MTKNNTPDVSTIPKHARNGITKDIEELFARCMVPAHHMPYLKNLYISVKQGSKEVDTNSTIILSIYRDDLRALRRSAKYRAEKAKVLVAPKTAAKPAIVSKPVDKKTERVYSETTRKKLSDLFKKRWRESRATGGLLHVWTEERKKKQAERCKKQWAEAKAAGGQLTRKVWTDEQRQKFIASKTGMKYKKRETK